MNYKYVTKQEITINCAKYVVVLLINSVEYYLQSSPNY